jgi:hypothetical protein
MLLAVLLCFCVPAAASAKYLHVARAERAAVNAMEADGAWARCHRGSLKTRPVVWCHVWTPAHLFGMDGILELEVAVYVDRADHVAVVSDIMKTWRERL